MGRDHGSEGTGSSLFYFMEQTVNIMLSTAMKNDKSIPRFYIDELGRDFRSAGLFGKLS